MTKYPEIGSEGIEYEAELRGQTKQVKISPSREGNGSSTRTDFKDWDEGMRAILDEAGMKKYKHE